MSIDILIKIFTNLDLHLYPNTLINKECYNHRYIIIKKIIDRMCKIKSCLISPCDNSYYYIEKYYNVMIHTTPSYFNIIPINYTICYAYSSYYDYSSILNGIYIEEEYQKSNTFYKTQVNFNNSIERKNELSNVIPRWNEKLKLSILIIKNNTILFIFQSDDNEFWFDKIKNSNYKISEKKNYSLLSFLRSV